MSKKPVTNGCVLDGISDLEGKINIALLQVANSVAGNEKTSFVKDGRALLAVVDLYRELNEFRHTLLPDECM